VSGEQGSLIKQIPLRNPARTSRGRRRLLHLHGLGTGCFIWGKNLKEAFVYAGKNFTNTFLRNSKGVLIKSLKTKLTKFGKEMMSELGSSVVFDATMTYFEDCVTRSFGG
jgi:hypothetical protein